MTTKEKPSHPGQPAALLSNAVFDLLSKAPTYDALLVAVAGLSAKLSSAEGLTGPIKSMSIVLSALLCCSLCESLCTAGEGATFEKLKEAFLADLRTTLDDFISAASLPDEHLSKSYASYIKSGGTPFPVKH